MLADAKEFLVSERWYTERGIPYRRGYLLWGIPGGGKSSLVMAIASELKLPIYSLQLSSQALTDESLHRLLQNMTITPSILLLEDIDAETFCYRQGDFSSSIIVQRIAVVVLTRPRRVVTLQLLFLIAFSHQLYAVRKLFI